MLRLTFTVDVLSSFTQGVVVVNGIPITRNQNMVMNALVEQQSELIVCCVLCANVSVSQRTPLLSMGDRGLWYSPE